MTDPASHLEQLFPGDSEMAGRMRAFDWSASAFGPTRDWPENLRVAIRLCLTSRFPICLWWARPLRFLYNDAFLPWLSDTKHPRALMQLGHEVWSEDWPIIGPMLERVIATGDASWSEDTELYHNRKVPQEEVYITWSFTPILAADGHRVDGIFCPCSETTEKVIGARRLQTLRKLAVRAGEARTVDRACDEAAAVLGENTRDVPFVAIYVVGANGDEARLSAAMPTGEHRLPSSVRASDDDAASPWPLARVLRTKRAADCLGIDAHGVQLHAGPWRDFTQTALVIPIHAAQEGLAGLLVVGVSPRRPLDAAYRTFFDLVAGHVATAISGAQAYEAQRERVEALAQIDRAKTAFFSNVSHEFRTPLTLMLGPVEDALADAAEPLPLGQRERLETVHRSSLRLLKLVNTLLDFSRIEAGRVQAVYEPTDLAAVTAGLVSNFRSACDKAGLRLTVDCPPMPKPVYVDRDMWEKIVLNLVSNAFKFTLAGMIEVCLRTADASAQLSVRDTGIGIPAEELPRVFERFHRVEGARGRTLEGTGIGLALVHELVKLHGGSVRVDSTQGAGSTFLVSVPLGTAHLPADRIGAPRTLGSTTLKADVYVEEALRWLPDDTPAGSFPRSEGAPREALRPEVPAPGPPPGDTGPAGARARRPHVLWADDNQDMRDYVRRLLGERYDVEAVADGEAALAAARARPPDLVLADVMMPRLDGFGLLRALRGDLQTRTIPVILLSARAGEDASVEGLRAGADDYIVKPFSARELLARVAAHLDMARVRAESERRVTRILDNITDAFQVIDADWRITYMNPMAKEVFAANGLGPAAMIGKHFWNDVFQDSKDDEFATQLHRVMAERIPVEFESYYAPWQRWFRGRIDALPDGGVAHYFQDITERKKAEQALRESEERFRRYFELGLIGIAITSPTKECLEVNDEICRILGYEENDLLKKTWPEMTHPDDLAAAVAQFDRVIAGEIDGYTMDKRWLRKDGRAIDTTMSVKCVRRDDGSVDYFIALVQDITERRRAEEALRKSRQALEEADRRKDEFLAMLAHELRNPLASILTGSQLLRRLAHESPSAHETRIMIEREVERLARLVDDLLDVSRITAGRIVLRREPLDLRDVVQRAIDTTRPVVETRRHRVELALPNTPLPIEADVVRLGQVFSNVLNNAAKYTNPGGRIRVSAVATGSEAVVSVLDNGVGIASADLPHIFDLFNRGQRSSDHTDGGLGVGLTLARRLSELHGGSVDAASDGPGCGSEFVVRLPLAASLLAPAPAQPVSAPARPRRILVIDDNESFVAAMSGLLRAMGHEVRTIPDGSAAVATARAFRPHVVLLDIGLPGLSGYAVAHALRQDPAVAAVRIIAITGYGQEQDKRHAVAAGIDQHLTKPVDDTVLATLIDAAGTD